ncbi:MAG: SUF system NifU family Fe-S cluster assembly protein [Candidatus Sumerlaeaceae bacterium]|nr:SUF system NifU family Fe-S cluster assembly protein [Candidatus Sumerlaeaceae bacterium]
MSDLRELYQEVILDHNKKPRNCGRLETANRMAEGFNPLCGDRITLYLKMNGDVIEDVSFEGKGCAISTASASLMTSAIKGKTIPEAETLFDSFHGLVTGHDCPVDAVTHIGKLAVFGGVREFPARVKCATLAWHTLKSALEGKIDAVTTE